MFIRILSRDPHRLSRQAQEQEKEQITKHIENDLKSMDLKISLYIAACGGLPLSEIHPSPPAISSDSNRIENACLLSVNDSIPPPESLLALLKHPEGQVLSTRTYGVLKWLTLGLVEPKITYMDPETHQDILKWCIPDGNTAIQPEPEAVFSLKPHRLSTLGQEWASRACYDDTSYAFLPCNVEYLHCLIYKGLVSNTLEKDGSLILYTDLKYCVNIAPSAWTWGKSMLGVNLKVIAIVEFVDNLLNARTEVNEIAHSEFGDVTLKNYKLLDSAYGRIRYLLVYPQEKRHPPFLIRSMPEKKGIVQRTMALTWAIVICLALVLPTIKNVENNTTLN